jgi:endoglycosylceramidase
VTGSPTRTPLAGLALAVVLLLAACGGDDGEGGETGAGDTDASASLDDRRAAESDDDDAVPPVVGPRFITDDRGRALVFHGCNFDGSAKGDSGLPQRTDEELHGLAGTWGFNFARYLIFWARIEPDEPGVYDEAYLDAVEEWLDRMAAAGVAVVLDMHQDVWGPFAGSPYRGEHSDGAPEWATITDGRPFIDFAGMFGAWAFNYLSPDVMRAFDNFWAYDRHPELQDGYAAMWAHVAARFKDHPAILGYDLMNEPWQGTGLLRYRDFDENEYTQFNQRMIDAIRAVDEDGWIFYEPNAFLANQGGRSYVKKLDDPRDGPDRVAYFPHLYPVLIDLLGGYDPAKDHALDHWEAARVEEAKRQDAPMLSGEWAMLYWFDDANRFLWNDRALRTLERVTSGWAYWDCGFFLRDEGDAIRSLVASAYPRKIAGSPVAYGYDPVTGVFQVAFDEAPGVTGPTEIYLPASRDYSGGWTLEVSDPDGAWESEWDDAAQVLRVWTDPTQPRHVIRVVPGS